MAIGRLLIANRGEIAVRIARTARASGIATVGIYAEPDARALHLDTVDEAVALGGATPADSYLRVDAIVEAARATGCDAVHPGYGFLAENAEAAGAIVDAGLVWVGPTPDQIALLGDKTAAKQAALDAGVHTTPFALVSPDEDPAAALAAAGIELPVLVKAAGGGGGRGMRLVTDPDALEAAVEAASREAASAFGDPRVFCEPYIARGRHVEVQIIGDTHGNVVHLGERECSIQRRNQKLIEEAPSPGVDAETRRRLHDDAVTLARHVGYVNAGTVEFLVGADGTVSFLEVNTRLQVEHPVTEAVTGLDLVALQLAVAAGEPLGITQDDITVSGHAIEARLVAEDPAAGWRPSVGTVVDLDIPAPPGGGPARPGPGVHVRVDSGVGPGSVVSPDYDSLLAKIVVHAPDRATAAAVLSRTLATTRVVGVATDAPALAAVVASAPFGDGDTPISFLDDHPELVTSRGPAGDERLALLLGGVFELEARARAADPVTGFAPSGWRNLRTQGQRRRWLLGDEEHRVEYVRAGADVYEVAVGDWPEPLADGSLAPDERRRVTLRLLARRPGVQVVEIDGRRTRVEVVVDGDEVHTRSPAGCCVWRLPPRFVDHDAEAAAGGPVSPLPGTVIAVNVEEGQTVRDGDVLVVVEAMKMEHRITAHTDATVTEVRVAVGDRVDAGDLLVALSGDA